MNEETIFQRALECDEQSRDDFLAKACEGDEELRRRLEARLDEELTKSFVAESLPPPPTAGRIEGPGTTIGPYRLQSLLGKGGFGVVFLADQTVPVRRQVALKVLKAGVDTEEVIARFEAERQALALMSHPHIATVLDAGVTPQGRSFFAMEHVPGKPLTEYCDLHRLGMKRRLVLFSEICRAVQHAHQKGVVHRDLKPSNILVTELENKATPKIIDFGIAKALDQQLTDKTLETMAEQVIGTPSYMSPEQTRRTNLPIDIRCDVFSLGVILYELLTGETPIRTAKGQNWEDALDQICEEEALPPSRVLSKSSRRKELAEQRRETPHRLVARCRGELDWICLKALEKNPDRRYQSASEFAADIERYLQGDVVEARPPSQAYAWKKFVSKNAVALGVASGFVTLVLVFGVISLFLAIFAMESRNEAVTEAGRAAEAEKAANVQKAEAIAARSQAEHRSEQLAATNEILGDIFDGIDPQGRDANFNLRETLSERMHQAIVKLDANGVVDSLDLARLKVKLGTAQNELGYPGKAIALLESSVAIFKQSAHASKSDDLALAQLFLADAYWDADQRERALALLQHVRESREEADPDSEETLLIYNLEATKLSEMGRLQEAIERHRAIVSAMEKKVGPNDVSLLTVKLSLARELANSKQYEESLALTEQLIIQSVRTRSLQDPITFKLFNLKTVCLNHLNQHEAAIELLEPLLYLRAKVLTPDHPEIIEAKRSLARSYLLTEQLPRAVELLQQAAQGAETRHGEDGLVTLETQGELAWILGLSGDTAQASKIFDEITPKLEQTVGPEHPVTLQTVGWRKELKEAARKVKEQ